MSEMKNQIEQLSTSAQSKVLIKKRGRPKCFDESKALQQATLMFWENGYEATSIGDLTKTLGITAPSLYSSFGDKAQLFQKCLDYYQQNESCDMDIIFQNAPNIQSGLMTYLKISLENILQSDKPKGCMFVLSTINCSEVNKQLQLKISKHRQLKKEKLVHFLKQAQLNQELRKDADITTLATYYSTLLQGMSIQARDGVTHDELEQVIELATLAWHANAI